MSHRPQIPDPALENLIGFSMSVRPVYYRVVPDPVPGEPLEEGQPVEPEFTYNTVIHVLDEKDIWSESELDLDAIDYTLRLPIEELVHNPPDYTFQDMGFNEEQYQQLIVDALHDDWCMVGLKVFGLGNMSPDMLAVQTEVDAVVAPLYASLAEDEEVLTWLEERFVTYCVEMPEAKLSERLEQYPALSAAERVQQMLPIIEEYSIDSVISYMDMDNESALEAKALWLMQRLDMDQEFQDHEEKSMLAQYLIGISKQRNEHRASGFFEEFGLTFEQWSAIVNDTVDDGWVVLGLKILPFADVTAEQLEIEVTHNRHLTLGLAKLHHFPEIIEEVEYQFVRQARRLPTETFRWLVQASKRVRFSPQTRKLIALVRSH